MKKIFLIMLLMILLAGTVSSLEWDNIGNYDEETRTIEVRNSLLGIPFLQLDKVAEIRLNTPLNYLVPAGERKIAEFEVKFFEDYNNVLKEVEMFDKRKGDRKFLRDYDFRVRSYENETSWNYWGNETYQRQKEVWTKLVSTDFKEGDILTIGIFTEVKIGDRVEWIPNFFGVRIDEWATFEHSETHGLTTMSDFVSVTTKSGMTISVNESVNITALKVGSACTPDMAFVQTAYASGVLGFTDVVGLIANFTPPITLTANTKYWILAYSEGAPYNLCFEDGGADYFPFDSGYIVWNTSVTQLGEEQYQHARNIELIWINVTEPPIFPPIVTLNSPIDTYNTTNPEITFNATVSDDQNLTNVTLIIDGIDNETNSSGINNTDYLFTKTLSEGGHNWTIRAFDNDSLSTTATTRNFTVDSLIPFVNITLPPTLLNYAQVGGNFSFNATSIDINIDTCWYDFNFTNTTYTCNTNTINLTVTDQRNITAWVNDTIGNLNSSFRIWDIKLLEQDQIFTTPTIEGSSEDFIINYSIAIGKTVTIANLWYDGTAYTGVRTSVGGQNYTASYSGLVMPSVATETNVSFLWSFVYSDSTQVNITARNQTVQDLNLDNCSSNTFLIYSYTNYDEEDKTILQNTSIEIMVNIYDLERESVLFNFSEDYGQTNPAQVCINIPLTNDTIYSLDSTVRYSSNQTGTNGHAIEYYNILNFTLANNTVSPDIELYDLLLDDSTEFQVTYRNDNLEFDADVLIYVNRQYVAENTFTTVEIPITDSNGQTILHLVRNDVLYNLIMIDIAGNILATFNSVTAFCQDFTIGECTLNLNADRGDDPLYNVTTDVGINYETSYSNSTQMLSLDFVSVDLTTETIGLEVIRDTDFGNRTICDEELTSSSGTIYCNLSSFQDRYLFINIYVNGEFKGAETLDTDQTEGGAYDVEGYFIAFLIMLLFITMFSDDKQAIVLSLLIGWIIIVAFSLIKGGLFGTASAGIWFIITMVLFLWKLRKERT